MDIHLSYETAIAALCAVASLQCFTLYAILELARRK